MKHRYLWAALGLVLLGAVAGGAIVAVWVFRNVDARLLLSDQPAKITIVQPTAGDVITSKSLAVKLELDGGKIVNIVSQDLTPNEGHVHVSVDGKILTQTFGLTQKLKAPNNGQHLLQAEFVAKDHGPFNPRVLSTVTFEEGKLDYDHRDAAGFIRLNALRLRTLGQRKKKLGL